MGSILLILNYYVLLYNIYQLNLNSSSSNIALAPVLFSELFLGTLFYIKFTLRASPWSHRPIRKIPWSIWIISARSWHFITFHRNVTNWSNFISSFSWRKSFIMHFIDLNKTLQIISSWGWSNVMSMFANI